MKAIYSILFSSFILLTSSFAVHAIETPQEQTKASASVAATININQASAVKLSELKGIGLKKAQAIIQYRETHGDFTQVSDLQNVKGIGAKFIEKNAKFLTI